MLQELDFSRCHVVVVGDVMLDRYWEGDAFRISPEAPVPVVKVENMHDRVGGAANVALNVRALGAKTTLIGSVGVDEAADTLTTLLQDARVIPALIRIPGERTTLKLRVLGRHQQLIRLDFETPYRGGTGKVLDALMAIGDNIDVLILSDYAKGILAEPSVLMEYAQSRGIKVLVDPKRQDVEAYRGAHYLTPNLAEFEAIVGPCETQAILETKGTVLLKALSLDGLLVTQGSQGMTLFEAEGATTHIPTEAKEVFDITGAGDTVIAVWGAMLAAGATALAGARLANTAAGLSVARLGTATVTLEELQWTAIGEIVSVLQLKKLIHMRRMQQQKIVMTNGCFDILHAGHVTYLKQARALGDCLIVAVNDDDSVRRLKGDTRPVNTLAYRMQILAALACVDYVVAFSEDTPENVIATILPDFLVKGGDYTPDQIAGGRQVVENGGCIKIVPLMNPEDCSTTSILARSTNKIPMGEVV